MGKTSILEKLLKTRTVKVKCPNTDDGKYCSCKAAFFRDPEQKSYENILILITDITPKKITQKKFVFNARDINEDETGISITVKVGNHFLPMRIQLFNP